jgi:hypothetical protein
MIFSVKQARTNEKFRLEKKIGFLKEDIDLLLANELWTIKSEQTRIDPEFKLNTLQTDSVNLKDVVGNGKLFFYFSEYDCQLCYQEIIDKLNKYVEMYNTKTVAVIAHFNNLRNFHFFLKNTKIDSPTYYTTKNINLEATNANQPFFFVLDQSFKTKFVFIPYKKYNENIEPYFSIVDDFLNHATP